MGGAPTMRCQSGPTSLSRHDYLRHLNCTSTSNLILNSGWILAACLPRTALLHPSTAKAESGARPPSTRLSRAHSICTSQNGERARDDHDPGMRLTQVFALRCFVEIRAGDESEGDKGDGYTLEFLPRTHISTQHPKDTVHAHTRSLTAVVIQLEGPASPDSICPSFGTRLSVL